MYYFDILLPYFKTLYLIRLCLIINYFYNIKMEYLPNDPNESELRNIEKQEKKLKEFREYIVDKGVVMGLVKGIIILNNIVLLSLKYAENKPKNPIKTIREFFGKYNDSKWDQMDVLKEEIIILNNENPKLFEKVQALEQELEEVKKNKRYTNLFDSYEVDKNVNIN